MRFVNIALAGIGSLKSRMWIQQG